MRLFDFAFVPNYPEPLDRLRMLAANEYWGRGGRMLRSYFNHMFDKVMDDGLMAYHENGDCAVFHTGLRTRSEQDIYAVFVPNERDDAQDWFFRGFSTRDAVGLGELLAQVEELPARARFIHRADQAFYALNVGAPECNWKELIRENVSRIPRQIIADATHDRVLLPDMREIGKDAFLSTLDEAAERLVDDEGMHVLVRWFEESLDAAMDNLQLDYKFAVPAWHARDKQVVLMIPLGLRQQVPNVVLAVNWNEDGNCYEGLNLLTMEMAYNNARLIARPEARWLLEGIQAKSNATSSSPSRY